MIIYTNDSWNAAGIEAIIDRLFVLLLDEATDANADYSFRPRLTNPLAQLAEIVSLEPLIEEFPPARHHLPPLIDELQETTQRDVIVANFIPEAKDAVGKLSAWKDNPPQASR